MIVIVDSVAGVRTQVDTHRRAGKRVGFVPTMGALHAGHAALIRQAAAENELAVVSIFVNPTQFGPNEDFAKYPRQLAEDAEIAAEAGAALIFAPTAAQMYPAGFATTVDVAGLGDHLCGRSRPGHFRGVCTVVAKLLNIVRPDTSYFGQKDAQQARIIERLALDLNLPGTVRVLPTVREPDGLAMSSRNRYLTAEQRRNATVLFRSLRAAEGMYAAGERNAGRIRNRVGESIADTPGARLDYAELVDAQTLQPIGEIERKSLLALAVFFGATRLIDNAFLG